MFSQRSRYAHAATFETTDLAGRRVRAVVVPSPPRELAIGRHVRREGERLDLLANLYLKDPTGYWRIAALNGAVLPDSLAGVDILFIPASGRAPMI
ncbi:hypothetical protein [Paraliomyxa miuraensis]|uniref:hypothetical protein n=1 Tax=Paraliomyxa miuraensis TaxID=376150 RepID=UPI002252A2A9|nr:hypothetical protein [Paraliomyxa miuraensis]MCX4247466.1 hypothetical protein [Paraliomyxa miuraensis]